MTGYLAPYTGRTRDNYAGYLLRWQTWLTTQGTPLEEATRDDIERWRAHLTGRGAHAQGVYSALTPVAGLYRWAVETRQRDDDPAYLIRRPSRPTRSQRPWLDPGQLRILLTHANRHADPGMRAAIHLWALVGLRPQEPRTLLISDIGYYEGSLTIGLRTRKGGGADRLTLPAPVEDAVLAACGDRRAGPVILNETTGTTLSKAIAAKRLDRILTRANLPHVTPYGLRAGFITLALLAGVPEREVMFAAGHSSSAQTAYYDRARHTLRSRAAHQLTHWLHAPHPAPSHELAPQPTTKIPRSRA